MVNYKRKVNSEKDAYGGFDSVIEIEDPQKKQHGDSIQTSSRSYGDIAYAEPKTLNNLSYKKQTQAVQTASLPKADTEGRQARLYNIKSSQQKNQATTTASSRNKVLLFMYLVAAIVLATVVIITGVLLANASDNANAFDEQLAIQMQILNEQDMQLVMLNDGTFLRGRALEIGMRPNDVVHHIDLIELSDVPTVAQNTNGFDGVTRGFARVFGR